MIHTIMGKVEWWGYTEGTEKRRKNVRLMCVDQKATWNKKGVQLFGREGYKTEEPEEFVGENYGDMAIVIRGKQALELLEELEPDNTMIMHIKSSGNTVRWDKKVFDWARRQIAEILEQEYSLPFVNIDNVLIATGVRTGRSVRYSGKKKTDLDVSKLKDRLMQW